MLNETMLMPTPEAVFDADHRVRESAQRLFDRLNPAVRDPQIPSDTPALPIYDWEIAGDTDLGLPEVRSALQLLDGKAVEVEVVVDEHRVVAIAH